MFFLIYGIIFLVLFGTSFIKEKRRFRNAVFLLFTIINFYIYALFILRGGEAKIINIILVFLLFVGVPISILIVSILFIIAGVITIKREGFRIPNLLSIVFGVGVWSELILLFLTLGGYFKSIFIIAIVNYSAFAMLYIGFTFVALMLYSWFYCILPKKKNYDYIIIHGAGLLGGERVTPLLAKRLQKGIEAYIKFGRHSKIIVSGGKGTDEKISEAEAMKNYLLENNIEEENIICENKSTTTLENLQFSKNIIELQKKKYKCLFVTNNYHVFRTSLFAKKINFNAQGLGCRTALYYLPTAFIREYIAIMWEFKWHSIVILGTMLACTILVIIL